ncbi:MAG: taurine ABC transporter permease [marine bacterium B5-7]|nr:MAG: taurine ABC transporter permease [marine bacterium B5-7]
MNDTSKSRDYLISISAVILFLVVWQLAATAGVINRNILASPFDLAILGAQQVVDGTIFRHTLVSLSRVISGFTIGAVLAIILGLAMGNSERFRIIINPIVEVLRPIPPLAWIPLAIIWFGIGETSKIFLIALTSFFPIVVNTFKGVTGLDRTLLRAARSFDVTPRKMLWQVALPAAMPDISTGLRVGWSLALAVLVAAEMIAAKSGLGFLITEAMNLGRFDMVVFGIVVIGIVSVATDALLRAFIGRYLLFWHRGLDSAGG